MARRNYQVERNKLEEKDPTWLMQKGQIQPLVSSLVVLNVEGERILARYTAKELFPTFDVEKKFEADLLKKSQTIPDLEENTGVFEHGQHIVVCRASEDLLFFVTSRIYENEVILSEVLTCWVDSLVKVLKNLPLNELNLLQHYEVLLLLVDELVDQEGVIMETDANELSSRTEFAMYSTDPRDLIPELTEQGFSHALQTAKQHLARTILK
ncbi:Coatomer subunit zeta-3 [Galdieria sulphuraria]|uniref:Coatomer subunit zeta n=1 Tax=Galdieria sulphuraria TaxID=130081 RepID=M2WZS8_GALSU|nr:coatomer protein complex, subunit zeta [Galdieria sulphuraria]EME29585.1 coatomer protein complex, subunit zeta [Galdieria sulphuraria]GJD12823.1 Coatomer subunit zeta-3 [Galdieria sulphuraria]|eukprot:XP_005706105.1 coatomer protein complex, subunit zeta [Galdieria sulphuraria]